MQKTLIFTLTLIFMVGGLCYAGVSAQQYALHQRQSKWSDAGIDYVTGGIGIPERKSLKTIGEIYTVKCVFAKENGDYLSDLKVEIQDGSQNTVVNTQVKGPWLYADLPRGAYTITASHDGKTKTRHVFVNERGLNVVRYYWK